MVRMPPQRLRARPRLFGNPTRTAILMLLVELEESYPRELARLVSASLSSVQLAVDGLEREGIIATRRIGSERRVSLNPRFFAYRQLKDLLRKMADSEPEIGQTVRAIRRRPRRRGKPL